jgi:3-oxoacyl-[acyl-carrier protein] reductase
MTQTDVTEHGARAISPLAVPPAETPGHDLLLGKKVVITAAAGTGIGFASARRALLEGADVLVSDWHERRLGEAAEKLAVEFPERTVAQRTCNVQVTADVDALISDAATELGRIDVLVNNAGLGGETPVADMTDEEWDRVLDITLTGTFRAPRAALRYFGSVEHNGVIVNNASVLGWRAQRGQAHYAAAKAGVMAFTRCSALEAADVGVRINAIAPSIAKHPFLAKVTSDDLLDELASKQAYGRA